MGAEFVVKRGIYKERVVTDGKREGNYIKGYVTYGVPTYTVWHVENVEPLNEEGVEMLKEFDGTIHLSYGEKV